MKQGVGGTWDKLEQVFEDRVARALSKLGVHTQSDVERLTARVDRLSEAVNELIKVTGVAPAKAARAPARKSAPKAAKPAKARAPKAVKAAKAAKAAAPKRPRAKKAAPPAASS